LKGCRRRNGVCSGRSRSAGPSIKSEDIFCYRIKRVVDNYQKISINNFKLSASGAGIGSNVELRESFNTKNKTALIRIWHGYKFIGGHEIKGEDLRGVQL